MQRYTPIFISFWLILASAFLCYDSTRLLTDEVRTLGGNSDEMVNINAIVNFYNQGIFVNTSNYGLKETQAPFSPYISTGPLALVPSLIGWEVHSSILYSRLACSIYAFSLVFLFSFFYGLRGSFRIPEALAFAAMSWVLVMMIPEWTFAKSLGELSGAVWFLLGAWLIAREKTFGFFFMGLSVWLCKITYLPAAFILLSLQLMKSRKSVLEAGLYFLAPLLLWLSYIIFKTDFAYAGDWVGQLMAFLQRGPNGVQQKFPVLTLMDRLTLNLPRWSLYYKSVFYFFFFLVMGLSIYLFRSRKFRPLPVIWGICLSVLFYDFWLLFGSPLLWPRHGQPALYLSLGLLICCAFSYLRRLASNRRSTLLSVSLFGFCLLTNNFSQSLFSDTHVRPELRGFKGLFMYADIYSPDYKKPIEVYQKLAQMSCLDLLSEKIVIDKEPLEESPAVKNQPFCKGRKSLPQTYQDESRSLTLTGYHLWATRASSDRSFAAQAQIFYHLREGNHLIEDSSFDLNLSVTTDDQQKILKCEWQDRWQLGNFLIQKLTNVVDLCAD